MSGTSNPQLRDQDRYENEWLMRTAWITWPPSNNERMVLKSILKYHKFWHSQIQELELLLKIEKKSLNHFTGPKMHLEEKELELAFQL